MLFPLHISSEAVAENSAHPNRGADIIFGDQYFKINTFRFLRSTTFFILSYYIYLFEERFM